MCLSGLASWCIMTAMKPLTINLPDELVLSENIPAEVHRHLRSPDHLLSCSIRRGKPPKAFIFEKLEPATLSLLTLGSFALLRGRR